MSKSNEATYITEARRELAKLQQNAKFFAAQYKKYRTHNPDVAQPYKTMAKSTFSRVRFLKRFIQKVVILQERRDQLALRIAELESKRKQ